MLKLWERGFHRLIENRIVGWSMGRSVWSIAGHPRHKQPRTRTAMWTRRPVHVHGLAKMGQEPRKGSPMKKVNVCKVSNVTLENGVISFTAHYTGGLKDQEVKTNWSVASLNLRVKYSVPAEEALANCASSEWVSLQARLRKTGKEFCDALAGRTMSATLLNSMIAAATPDTSGSGLKAENAKLIALLLSKGFTPEEIRKELSK